MWGPRPSPNAKVTDLSTESESRKWPCPITFLYEEGAAALRREPTHPRAHSCLDLGLQSLTHRSFLTPAGQREG